jgi:hypothetical protein
MWKNNLIFHSLCLVILGAVFIPSVYGAEVFTDRLYCVVNENSIQVTLQAQDNYLCTDYVVYLDATMQDLAIKSAVVQEYIDLAMDLDYWYTVQAGLYNTFYRSSLLRSQIVTAMQTFEDELLAKVQDYLALYTQDYVEQLRTQEQALENYDALGTAVLVYRRRKFLQEQITVLQQMFEVSNLSEFMSLLSRYLYLRKQLIWQLAW